MYTKEQISNRFNSDNKLQVLQSAVYAVLMIDMLHTKHEKLQGTSAVRDKLGFNLYDAKLLLPIVEKLRLYQTLNTTELNTLVTKMPKYAEQIAKGINEGYMQSGKNHDAYMYWTSEALPKESTENLINKLHMKLIKDIKTTVGTIIPAGTELHFSNEGLGYYNGETIHRQFIPEVAIERDAITPRDETISSLLIDINASQYFQSKPISKSEVTKFVSWFVKANPSIDINNVNVSDFRDWYKSK